jgi:hypothetical protein
LLVSAWRGGVRLERSLPVSAYQINWDAERRIQGQAVFIFADPHGTLWPRKLYDALAPAGSRLEIEYVFGATGTRVPLGVWRIRRTVPETYWQWRKLGENLVLLPGGGTVTVEADEETASLMLDRLDIGKRQPTKSTVLAEIEYLVADYMSVFANGVADRPLPASVEYNDDRLATVVSQIERLGATFRMSPSGEMEIIPAEGVPVDWIIEPGDGGTLVRVEQSMDDRNLANAVTAFRQFTDDDGNEHDLQGRSELTNGALAYGGAFGKVRVFRAANLATEQSQVQMDAETTLARITAAGDVPLTVDCLANPAIQLGDVVPLTKPMLGGVATVTGRVTAMTLTSRNGVMDKSMRIRLAVPHEQFENIGEPHD